jgi:drug/metabolite transporter (DMT)-like permease
MISIGRYLLLDETLDGVQLAGAGVTLLSIYLVNKKVKTEPQDE